MSTTYHAGAFLSADKWREQARSVPNHRPKRVFASVAALAEATGLPVAICESREYGIIPSAEDIAAREQADRDIAPLIGRCLVIQGGSMFIDPDNTIRLIPFGGDLSAVLRYMQRNGSSVDLNYGEDTELWECSWVTGGERYTTFSDDPTRAAQACLCKVAVAHGDIPKTP